MKIGKKKDEEIIQKKNPWSFNLHKHINVLHKLGPSKSVFHSKSIPHSDSSFSHSNSIPHSNSSLIHSNSISHSDSSFSQTKSIQSIPNSNSSFSRAGTNLDSGIIPQVALVEGQRTGRAKNRSFTRKSRKERKKESKSPVLRRYTPQHLDESFVGTDEGKQNLNE